MKKNKKKMSAVKSVPHPLRDEKKITNLILLEEELMMKSCSIRTVTDLTTIYSVS